MNNINTKPKIIKKDILREKGRLSDKVNKFAELGITNLNCWIYVKDPKNTNADNLILFNGVNKRLKDSNINNLECDYGKFKFMVKNLL